jgi:hypothetical protein
VQLNGGIGARKSASQTALPTVTTRASRLNFALDSLGLSAPFLIKQAEPQVLHRSESIGVICAAITCGEIDHLAIHGLGLQVQALFG